ncbi:MAG: hypothetical protein QXH26_00905 [Candidatus Hadarchaeales archaeon]
MRAKLSLLILLASAFLAPSILAQQSSSPLWSYGAEDGVTSVSISGNGSWVVGGGLETSVWVFRRESGTPTWQWRLGGYSYINSVAISADGSHFLVGCNDGKVLLYRWAAGQATPVWERLDEGRRVSPYPRAVAISGDGSWCAVGTTNGEVILFSKESREPKWIEKCGSQVFSVSISRNGRYVVAATDNGAFVFDNNGRVFSSPTGFSVATAISDDGSILAVGNRDGMIRVMRPDGSVVKEFLPALCVWALDMSSDGRYIFAAVSGQMGGESVGKVLKYTLEGEIESLLETKTPMFCVAASSDGSRVFAADDRNTYFFENGRQVWRSNVVKSLYGAIECVDISDAGDCMVACTARSDTEHKVYFFTAEPRAVAGPGLGRTNMILVAVCLVVVILAVILVLRRRILKEMET